eukprot:9885713-Prorocentrum_lima.AAC.1
MRNVYEERKIKFMAKLFVSTEVSQLKDMVCLQSSLITKELLNRRVGRPRLQWGPLTVEAIWDQ